MSGTRGEAKTASVVSFYGFALAVILVDQGTKFLVLSKLPVDATLPIIPQIFHLTLVYNRGIAFGLFNQHETLLLILITLSLLVLIILGFRIARKEASESTLGDMVPRFGLALILGGAIGNWIDRLRYKAVIDFLDFRVWPVFNVADSAITIGVALYLLLFLKKNKS